MPKYAHAPIYMCPHITYIHVCVYMHMRTLILSKIKSVYTVPVKRLALNYTRSVASYLHLLAQGGRGKKEVICALCAL